MIVYIQETNWNSNCNNNNYIVYNITWVLMFVCVLIVVCLLHL